jgi:glyoxylase-like metal-dependent hydrolase (beta-lactamase superfamily II)
MKIEQIYTGCLLRGLLLQPEKRIIDPLRETQPYIDRLKEDGVTLKYIFETHFHADFVSGHLDLSQKPELRLFMDRQPIPEFEAIIAEDNQIFEVGNIKIKVLHTPGHTLKALAIC